MNVSPTSIAKGSFFEHLSPLKQKHFIDLFTPHGNLVMTVTRSGHPNIQSYASSVVSSKEGITTKQFTPNDKFEKINVHSGIKPFHAGLLISFINELKEKDPKIKVPELSLEELAVLSASHSGTRIHRTHVRSALEKVGLNESYMTCGGRYPSDEESRNRLIKADIIPSKTPIIYDQCSGHHACQGRLSKLMDKPLEDYWKPNDTVQEWLLQELKKCSNDDDIKIIPYDNCNIPTFNLSLGTFANLYSKFVSEPQFKLIIEAMTKHPFLVGSETSLDSCLMNITSGNLIAKLGAEGLVIVINKKEESCLVLKEWGGNGGYRDRITIQTLREIGWLNHGQAATLSRLPNFKLEDEKHNVKYEFNKPLFR